MFFLRFSRQSIFLITLSFASPALAQQVRLSGRVLDATSGESLPFATVVIKDKSVSTQANAYGFYSLLLEKGRHMFEVSFVGYKRYAIEIQLDRGVTRNFELQPQSTELSELVIKGEGEGLSSDMIPGKNSLSVAQVKNMPTLGGEADIFQSLQFLPGVRTAVEGTTGLSVRGGSFDQTLVLLDEAPVYNPSHALGFYSSFNPDAIKSIDIYKGALPAQYGGRLSSVVDLRMKEGNDREFKLSGGLGLIAARLTAEGPIKKERASFIFSTRYSYAGLTANTLGNIAKSIKIKEFQTFKDDNDIRFYDLNGKINWKSASNKDHIFVSAYSGSDWFKYYLFQKGTFTKWQNNTGSLRWYHIFNQRLFLNSTLYFSKYNYRYNLLNDRRDFNWKAGLTEIGIKNEIDFFMGQGDVIKMGLNFSQTGYQPGEISPRTASSLTVPFKLESKRTLQGAGFVGIDKRLARRIMTNWGLRISSFALLGPSVLYNYNGSDVMDSTSLKNGKLGQFKWGFEPRFSAKYQLDSSRALSFAFTRTLQYVHLLSNSSVALPTDIWLPSNNNAGPQSSTLFSVGIKQKARMFVVGIEAYYKAMRGVIDFIDNADLFVNQYIDSQIRSGTGRAIGLETLLEKKSGRITGWVTYTLAKTDRTIAGINNGLTYPTRYDRRHSFSVVTSFQATRRLTFSTDFQFNSGGAASLPTTVYEYQGSTFNYYSKRNGFRLPAYHRLDIQCTFSEKKKWGDSQWVVGIYNAYNRRNLFSVELVPQDYNYFQYSAANAVSLYGIVPSISYNFKF
ncbi:TonB-dependent receptor [Dyadobacter sp. 676]|uniref:TonB-dependent receptor n=1 Tax=Dyadobacter sp. 676 TaxID=3088362 RepID=A0AAU8FPJ1_9BACT